MEALLAHKNISASQGLPSIPEKSENRRATDLGWNIAFGVTILVTIVFCIYGSTRVFSEKDDSSFNTHEDINLDRIANVIELTLIPIVLSIIIITLYRYATSVIIYGSLILGLICLAGLTVAFWVLYNNTEDLDSKSSFMLYGIILVLVLLVYLFLLAAFFRTVKLLIKLYREAATCFFDMPLMMIVPITSVLVQVLFVVIIGLTIGWLASTDSLSYIIILLVFVLLWEVQVLLGVQYMTVAGAVAHWYFDKKHPHKIRTSLWNTFRFHLGTICLGGLIIAVIDFLRFLLRSLTKNNYVGVCAIVCLGHFEATFKFISNNAFIETAIHGEPFLKSGKRAVNLIFKNIEKIAGINTAGNFVQLVCYALIFGATLGFSYLVFKDDQYLSTWLLIMALNTLVIVFCFFAVYKTMVETLLICYCEDVTLNNGRNKPYQMSQNLKQFIQEAKQTYNVRRVRNQTPAVA